MNVRYIVGLLDADRDELLALTRGGSCGARKLKRAQILLAADRGVADEEISRAAGVAVSTVYRTKQKYVLGGVDHALNEKRRSGGQRKLGAKDEARLIALACSDPPEGCRVPRSSAELIPRSSVAVKRGRSSAVAFTRRRHSAATPECGTGHHRARAPADQNGSGRVRRWPRRRASGWARWSRATRAA